MLFESKLSEPKLPIGDPVARARVLATVREAVLSGGRAPVEPRTVVSDSWRRSLDARIDPERGSPPQVFDRREVRTIRSGHPLARVLPMLRDSLVGIADEAMHMMIVTDADGLILWCEGQSDVRRNGERVGLAEGTRWTEDAVGTNAMGTALAADRPVQIHSAEHLVRTYHAWTCAAAPIHDPDTGQMIGSVDITGPMRTFHPATLALVTTSARLAEAHLRADLAERDERLRARNLTHLMGLRDQPGALLTPSGRVLAAQPDGWLPDRVPLPLSGDRVDLGRHGEGVLEALPEGFLLRLPGTSPRWNATLALRFLGSEPPVARLNGREIRLTLRHAELLTVLALHPAGLTAEQLATHLYGPTGNPVSVRAEVHRLRAQLDSHVLRTQPYRLNANVQADFLEVRAALATERVTDAVDSYRGPLLPRSEAPAIRDEREDLLAVVRRTVLGRGDTHVMWQLASTPDGAQDEELAEHLLRALSRTDPRRAIVAAGLARASRNAAG
jgi:GAF domain